MLMITGAILLQAGVIAMTSNRTDGLAVVALPLGLIFLITGTIEHFRRGAGRAS